jgi:hypothetical protein
MLPVPVFEPLHPRAVSAVDAAEIKKKLAKELPWPAQVGLCDLPRPSLQDSQSRRDGAPVLRCGLHIYGGHGIVSSVFDLTKKYRVFLTEFTSKEVT